MLCLRRPRAIYSFKMSGAFARTTPFCKKLRAHQTHWAVSIAPMLRRLTSFYRHWKNMKVPISGHCRYLPLRPKFLLLKLSGLRKHSDVVASDRHPPMGFTSCSPACARASGCSAQPRASGRNIFSPAVTQLLMLRRPTARAHAGRFVRSGAALPGRR